MSQAGYTPISLYYSTTAAAVPVNTNLANGELAINITDGKLYYKDNAGTVKLLAGATAGPAGGSTTQVQFNSSGVLAGSANMTFNGTTLTVNDFADSSLTSGRVTYAGASGNLNDSANLTFDGTNLTVGGSATATRFIPSGSTVATNGMYLQAANTLGFSTNSTEAIRIDSSQQVGIGGTPSAGQNLFLAKNITGATTAQGIRISSVVQSDVTTDARGVISLVGTAASSFTLATLNQFFAGQGTFGAGSVVTNQIGYYAAPSLTGATNNYGFYGAIASGTGRYNLYMAGTADNYLAGSLGIGGTPTAGITVDIQKAQTGATSAYTISARINPDSTVTSSAYGYATYAINGVGTSTPTVVHYYANQGTFSGTAPTNQYGFFAPSSLTGATNNYGFYSGIASGTGRWNFYAAGTASNFFGGKTYIAANYELFVGGTTDATTPSLLSDGTYIQINAPASTGDIRLRVAGNERLRINGTSGAFGLSGANYGTSGQVLTSGGSGAAPTWTTVSGGGSAATPTALGTVYGKTGGSGAYQTFFGYRSGNSSTANYDTALGYQALFSGASGGNNTAIGMETMYSTTTGAHNTAIGSYDAGTFPVMSSNTTGSYNIAVGNGALKSNTTASNNTAVGYQAAYSNTANRVVAVGYQAAYSNTSGEFNVAMGTSALFSNTTGADNIAIGSGSLYQTNSGALAANTTGTANTAVGAGSMYQTTTGGNNTAVGNRTMVGNTTGGYNVAIGGALDGTSLYRGALGGNTTGNLNAAVGNGALSANTTASNNAAFGSYALLSNTTGANNTALGSSALQANTTVSNNTAVGTSAAGSNTAGGNLVALGRAALFNNTSGNDNVAVGYNALYGLTTGSDNIGIGIEAGKNISTGGGNTVIGTSPSGGTYAPVFNVTTESNRFVAGHTSVSNAYVNVAWTVVSDLRDKIVLGDVPLGLDFVRKLKPIKYQFKESRESNTPHGTVKYGFGAQDVLAEEGNNPVIVDTESAEKLKITDSYMMPVFANAIKEMADMIDQLKAEIAALKGA